MLYSSYQQLKHSKYFLYLLLDLVMTYGAYQYWSDSYTLFDWVLFLKIYTVILVIQLIFVARDGVVNSVFLKLNERFLVEGLVTEFRALRYPKNIEHVDSGVQYLESVVEDPTTNVPLKLNAAKYLNFLKSMQLSSSGWVNHKIYTTLLEKAIHQYVREV